MWEAIFLLVILKIPVIYVCCVVWWAIRAEPKPFDGLEPALVVTPSDSDPRPGTQYRRPRPSRGNGPHGRPRRTYDRRPARVTA